MNARLEKIENSEAYLEVKLDAEAWEAGLDKAYRKVVKQVEIPGFRKGKVPRQFLEAHFGKEILYEDAMEFVIPNAYENAIEELKLEPIAQPELDINEIKADEPPEFKVKVAIKPEVKLGEMEGLEIIVPLITISDQDVETKMEEMRSRYAQLVEKMEGTSELGDTVTIDFAGSIDGEVFEGGTSEDYKLELGSDSFIPGFEDQLIGLQVGASKDVEVTFPEDYHAEELAGQAAVFKTTINKIEQRIMRELDDEFAQEVSEFDTIEELRNNVRENLIQTNDNHINGIKRREVLDKALEQCTVDIAPAVAEMEFQNMLEQFEQRLGSQGIGLEQYFQLTNSSVDDFKQDMLVQAERNAKTNFMLEKIVEEKGIEITDEEVDKQVEEIANQTGLDVEMARMNLESVWDSIMMNMKMDKAVKYLIDNAVIKEPETVAEESQLEEELAD